jgi:hypothetical protein
MIAKPASIASTDGEIAPVEASLGEVARDKGRQRICHQIAAGRSEQAKRSRWQRRRCGKHRQTGNASGEIQDLARGAEP